MPLNVPIVDSAGDDPLSTLGLAYTALAADDPNQARNLAQSALLSAKVAADLRSEAKALVCLAHCDRVSSRLKRATGASRRAAELFHRVGDLEGEVAARTVLAQVCVLLGRNDEAVEAAALSVRLSALMPATVETVLAHNYLGVAYCWSGNFERATASLDEAIETAARCTPSVSTYQPTLNKAWVEASRLLEERYQVGAMTGLKIMRGLVDEYERLGKEGGRLAAPKATMPVGETVSLVLAGILFAWEGHIEAARGSTDFATRSLRGVVTWLDSLVQWLVAEVAWAAGDFDAAHIALLDMRELALSADHEQLACIAHLLLAQVFEQQGNHEAARTEHRALRIRERQMRSESVRSREELVNWQLDVRQSETRLQQALRDSKQFERLSFEDSLTGIANRRRFELALAERLHASASHGTPLTVAMLDVDNFKSINDTFTHKVGDQVLKALAAVLSLAVRENDMPARLAGDEFVVLFEDAHSHAAEEICERIRAAVVNFDWNRIAQGLRVTVSIGVGEAVESDTVESLLHRSDESMYVVKTSRLQSLY